MSEAYQINLGEEAKEKAIQQVEQAADPEVIKKLRLIVKAICTRRADFTTDSVHAVADANKIHIPEKRLLGAVMNYAKKMKWCFPTERHVKSKRKENHARPVRVWRSNLV